MKLLQNQDSYIRSLGSPMIPLSRNGPLEEEIAAYFLQLGHGDLSQWDGGVQRESQSETSSIKLSKPFKGFSLATSLTMSQDEVVVKVKKWLGRYRPELLHSSEGSHTERAESPAMPELSPQRLQLPTPPDLYDGEDYENVTGPESSCESMETPGLSTPPPFVA